MSLSRLRAVGPAMRLLLTKQPALGASTSGAVPPCACSFGPLLETSTTARRQQYQHLPSLRLWHAASSATARSAAIASGTLCGTSGFSAAPVASAFARLHGKADRLQPLAAAAAAASSKAHAPLLRRQFNFAGNAGNSGSGPPNPATLFSHPTLRKAVKICGACSASASHSDSHPHNRPVSPGAIKGGTLQWEDAHEELQLQRRAHLVWDGGGPKTAFIVKKSGSARTSAALRKIADWLEGKGIEVLIERRVAREFPQYRVFDPCRNDADFCITLGGDGTVLHLTSLFVADEPLPPVVAFAMGTLGFLTPYDVDDYANALTRVLGANDAPVFCTLRTRKCCEVFLNGQRQAVHHVLNECLVDRGASPAMVTLQVSADRHHITTVQADGLIISTPSGSTAYSMSAGGPMVAPSVAGTLITPIAPHSLSFRPLVVPESSEIVVQIPKHARSHARASFDGRHTMRLQRGSAIRCTTSKCALPMVSLGYLDRDWYEGISTKLKWNISIRDTGPIEEPVPELPADIDPHDSCPLPDSLDDYDTALARDGAPGGGNGSSSKYL